jgi:hypothetical protein
MQQIEASLFNVAVQQGQSWPEWVEFRDRT